MKKIVSLLFILVLVISNICCNEINLFEKNFAVSIIDYSKFVKITKGKKEVLFSRKNIRLFSFELSEDKEWVYIDGKDVNDESSDEVSILYNIKFKKEIPFEIYSKYISPGFLGFSVVSNELCLEGFPYGVMTTKHIFVQLKNRFYPYLKHSEKK